MLQYVLRENVLTDDVLTLAEEGKVFKGGYIGYVEYHTFRNAWSDDKHVKRFRTEKSLRKYLDKNYTPEEVQDLDFYGSCLESIN
jgi:hypothetical protein